MNYNIKIKKDIESGIKNHVIARKLYMYEPTFIFETIDCFNILNSVSIHFDISFNNIIIVGSSKTGNSYYKSKEFELKNSDLDLAIIDSGLFLSYIEKCSIATEGYTDTTQFKDANQLKSFKTYIAKGIFRPDMMPNCKYKYNWLEFFNKLSLGYTDYFKDINCHIYASQYHFERKQSSLVNHFLASKYKKGDDA